jgi:hypothetical protein
MHILEEFKTQKAKHKVKWRAQNTPNDVYVNFRVCQTSIYNWTPRSQFSADHRVYLLWIWNAGYVEFFYFNMTLNCFRRNHYKLWQNVMHSEQDNITVWRCYPEAATGFHAGVLVLLLANLALYYLARGDPWPDERQGVRGSPLWCPSLDVVPVMVWEEHVEASSCRMRRHRRVGIQHLETNGDVWNGDFAWTGGSRAGCLRSGSCEAVYLPPCPPGDGLQRAGQDGCAALHLGPGGGRASRRYQAGWGGAVWRLGVALHSCSL